MVLAAFLSDSINLVPEGLPAQWYGTICAARLGWTTTMRGLSGSGFVARGVEGKCFADVVQADIIAHAPDVVVVEGGLNDYGQDKALDATVSAAEVLFVRLHTALPSAAIYFFGMYLPHTPSAVINGSVNTFGSEVAFSQGLRAAAANAGLFVIDPGSWITGTGNVTAPAGNGNADAYIRGTGDPHPTQAGAAYVGTRLAFAIRPPATGLDY